MRTRHENVAYHPMQDGWQELKRQALFSLSVKHGKPLNKTRIEQHFLKYSTKYIICISFYFYGLWECVVFSKVNTNRLFDLATKLNEDSD